MAGDQTNDFVTSLLARGETGRLIAARDWSRTSLGSIEAWPQSLKTTTDLLLRSPLPIVLLWGEDGVMLYNDAYSVFAGGRHPELLGSKVREGWPEVADFNDNVMKVCLAGGTLAYKEQELTLYRHGRPEQVWMNLDYSPVADETGRPAGVIAIVAETTERVLAERRIRESEERQRFLLGLGDAVRRLAHPEAIVAETTRALGERLKATRVAYAEIDDAQDRAAVRDGWTDGTAPHLPFQIRISDFDAAMLDPLRSGRTLRVDDIRADPRTSGSLAALEAIGARAIVSVPLFKDRRFVGNFNLHQASPRAWTDSEVELIEAVAERTWEAIERARSEMSLRVSEARLASVLESVSDGFYAVDREWRFTVFNPVAERYFKRGREQVLGHVLWDVFPEAVGSGLEAAIRSVMAGGGPTVVEARSTARPDRIVELRASPKLTGGVAVSFTDITERVRASERLRESEARLRTLTNALPAFVWFATPDGELQYFNDRWYEYTGQTPEEALPRGWAATLHPDDAKQTASTWDQARAAGTTYEIEVRYRRHDGAYRWYVARAEPMRDAAGAITAWFGTSSDIHDRRSAEAELQRLNAILTGEVEERTRERDRIFEMSNDLFAVAGFDGYLKTINPAWSSLLGYPEEELLARPFIELVHPDDHGAAAEIVGLLRTGGAVQSFEDRLVRADGKSVWIAWTAVPEGDRFYAVGRDVTQDRLREEAIRQSQKMEAVGQLTGGIAHDFNNLLGAVVGSFDLIRRKPGDLERVKRYAEAGLQAAERGAKLTGQLLAFSRAQRLEARALQVSDLVEGMRDLLDRTLGPLVRLTLDLDGARAAVLSDPTQLEMAVLNLAINARDAMPQGGEITISTRVRRIDNDPEIGSDDYVELAVRDTGTGMAPDVAARALDPFFTTKGVGKGTGLGLSQVYGIARQAGGTVRIESTPGSGTTVRVLLPRTNAPVRQDAASAAEAQAAGPRRARILVVDDDPDMRRALVDSLEALGFGVTDAEDGPSGLAKLEQDAPDLMMVDFAMPGMNGAEVAKAARALRPNLPIVFASGYADTAAIEAVAGENAAVLRKPFRVDDLLAVLTEALRGLG